MKKTIYSFKGIAAGLTLGVAIGFIASYYLVPRLVVSDVSSHSGNFGWKTIAYTNGTGKIIIDDWDNAPSRLEATIYPLRNDRLDEYIVPNTVGQGSVWQRAVITYDDQAAIGCQRHIIFAERPEKTIKQSEIPYCVVQTLDDHDITHYYALSEDQKTLAIGQYDGGVIATQQLPEGFTVAALVPNWEITKVAVLLSDNGMPVQAKLYMWDLATNTWDERPLPVEWSAWPDNQSVRYDHATDTFSLVGTKVTGHVLMPENSDVLFPIK